MSVDIRWMAAPDGKSFRGGTSTDLETLRDTFGGGDRITITESDATILRAMARAGRNNFFKDVAEVVEHAGTIEVWGVW